MERTRPTTTGSPTGSNAQGDRVPVGSPTPGVMPRTRRRGTGGRFVKGGGRSDGRSSLHPENLTLESRMREKVPVRFGRGRLDSLGNKGLAAYLIAIMGPPR